MGNNTQMLHIKILLTIVRGRICGKGLNMIHRCSMSRCPDYVRHCCMSIELSERVISSISRYYFDSKHDMLEEVISISHNILNNDESDNIFVVDANHIECKGFIYGWVSRYVGYIEWVIVNPSSRNKGIGTSLFSEIENIMINKGVSCITFDVNDNNKVGLAFANSICNRKNYKEVAVYNKLWNSRKYHVYCKYL